MGEYNEREILFVSHRAEWDTIEKRLFFIGRINDAQQKVSMEFAALSKRFELRTYLIGTVSALLELFPGGAISSEGDRLIVEIDGEERDA